MNSVYVCYIRCMICVCLVFVELYVWNLCMYIIRCGLCFLSVEYRLCYLIFQKLNTNCIFYSVVTGELTSACPWLLWPLVVTGEWHQHAITSIATVSPSSDRQMTSSRSSLIGSTITLLRPSLLWYHYSDVVITMSMMSTAIVTYCSFLQWCVVVVITPHNTSSRSSLLGSTIATDDFYSSLLQWLMIHSYSDILQ
jgi:hypothetical protein